VGEDGGRDDELLEFVLVEEEEEVVDVGFG